MGSSSGAAAVDVTLLVGRGNGWAVPRCLGVVQSAADRCRGRRRMRAPELLLLLLLLLLRRLQRGLMLLPRGS